VYCTYSAIEQRSSTVVESYLKRPPFSNLRDDVVRGEKILLLPFAVAISFDCRSAIGPQRIFV